MQWFPVALAVVIDVGCGHHAPPPAPAPHGEGGELGTPRTAPNPPWSVTYADGSGNVYVFHDDGGGAEYTYDPVTPLESSSGTYSGGEPRKGLLDVPTIERLWTQLRALEADTASHTTAREMMTGSFKILEAGTSERSFIVNPSPALEELDRLVGELP